MGWLLLWTAVGLSFVGMLAGCGWMLWRKGRALFEELRSQGRTLSEALELLGELSASRPRL